MKPHKHAKLIKDWADGAEIEMYFPVEEVWKLLAQPRWLDEYQYRIKPEPKPDVVRYFYSEVNSMCGIRFSDCHGIAAKELKITWDGETGKLKSAEVLNA